MAAMLRMVQRGEELRFTLEPGETIRIVGTLSGRAPLSRRRG